MNKGRRNELFAAEAADWVIALRDADHQTRRAFAAWLRTSPEHIREFLAVSAIWGTVPYVPSQPTAEELVQLAQAQSNVVSMPQAAPSALGETPGRKVARHRWSGGGAAVLVLAFTAAAILRYLPLPQDRNLHATGTGEQASVPLPDGSMVTLNTRSTIRIAYSAQHRDIHLSNGEALFDVVEDAARPFRVMVEQAVIEAVGTQFNVRTNAEKVTVTVVEGIVEVSTMNHGAGASIRPDGPFEAALLPSKVRIRGGQQVSLHSGSGAAKVIDTAVKKVIAWREHRLIFDDVPLEQVIEEFNRYNDPLVVIEDQELKSLPISGVFLSNDRESFLEFLSEMNLAAFAEREDRTIALTGTTND